MAKTKKLLKTARKLIDDKNYNEALKLCQEVLCRDKKNYLCWVFIGKCYNLSKFAANALERAVSIDPRDPLAYKGLAKYYESIEDSECKVKLFEVYDALLQHDISKSAEIIKKISNLGCCLSNEKALQILIKYLDWTPAPEIYNAVVQELPKLLLIDVTYEQNYVIKTVNYIISNIFKNSKRTLCVVLAQPAIKGNISVSPLKETIYLSFLKAHTTFRKFICKLLCTQFIVNESFGQIDIKKYKNDLIKGIEKFKYSITLRSMYLYSNGCYGQAAALIIPFRFAKKNSYIENIFIIMCNIKLKRWLIVERCATYFSFAPENITHLIILEKCKFLAFAGQKKWNQAIISGRSLPIEYLTVEDQATLAKCCIENNEDAYDLLDNLRTTKYYLQLKALIFIVQKKYRSAISLLKETQPDSINYLYMAKIYWALKEYDKCRKYLLQSVRLDSKNADVFLYFGKLYHSLMGNYNKAKKFFERAYKLNPYDKTIVKHLRDMYLHLKENFTHLRLYTAYKTFYPDQKRIHLHLGHFYWVSNDLNKACFEYHLHNKKYRNDSIGLIYMAEAFYAKKQYPLAIENYNQAMELQENKKAFCLTRLGYIYYNMDEYMTALGMFRETLERDPDYIIAYKGAAESLITLAKLESDNERYDTARSSLQIAVDYLIRGVNLRKSIIIFWKLLAKVISEIEDLPVGYDHVYVRFDNNGDLMDLGKLKYKSSLSKLSEYCFWRAYCDPPDYLQRSRGQELSREILAEERYADLLRVPRP